MRVISGAGEFEIRIDRVTAGDSSLVLIGKMGVWDSETFMTADDLAQILLASLHRPSLWYLARGLPGALWRTVAAAVSGPERPTRSEDGLTCSPYPDS